MKGQMIRLQGIEDEAKRFKVFASFFDKSDMRSVAERAEEYHWVLNEKAVSELAPAMLGSFQTKEEMFAVYKDIQVMVMYGDFYSQNDSIPFTVPRKYRFRIYLKNMRFLGV